MSDLELLFLVIAILYAWECACWLRVGSVGFITWFGRRWRLATPGTLLGNQRGGFILVPPLPPLGAVLVGQPLPFLFSTQGVGRAVAGGGPGTRLASNEPLTDWTKFSNIKVDGKKIRLNGARFYSASSAPGALQLAQQLDSLQKLAPGKRQAAIQELFHASLDTKAIETRWEDFSRRSAPLKILANWIFFHLFVFSPWLIWRAGLSRSWLGLLAGLLALTCFSAIIFHRVHKAFYPEAEDDRFTHFLIVLLSPVSTIRARDVLTRPLLEGFHPLAIAKVFCSEAAFKSCARAVALELRYPAPEAANPGPLQQAEQETRAMWLRAVERFFRKHGVDEEELTRPPKPNDESSLSYCPRCETQFTTKAGTCADCGGVSLRAFEQPIPGANAKALKKKGNSGRDAAARTR